MSSASSDPGIPPKPDVRGLSSLLPAARFYSREEAGALAALAAEANMVCHIMDPGSRTNRTFDGSLGGFDAVQGFTVCVAPEDLTTLETRLVEEVTVDPDDPLCGLTNADLHRLIDAPFDANLTERAIARKLLALRGPEADSEPAAGPDTVDPDPHRSGDARTARWIGGFALFVTAAYLSGLVVLVRQWLAFRDGMAEGWAPGYSATVPWVDPRDFSNLLGLIIPPLFPGASSAGLVFSRRVLRNGETRPMFPAGWRTAGWTTLNLSIAGYLVSLLTALFIVI